MRILWLSLLLIACSGGRQQVDIAAPPAKHSQGTFTGPLSYDDVIRQAQAAKGDDPFGYRTEFVQLVRKAKIAREM